MRKLLKQLNNIYINENIEKQYLVYFDSKGQFFYHSISDDVSSSALNSSYLKFKSATASFHLNKGQEAIIVHNHPSGSPRPSFMDYKNADLLNAWSALNHIPVKDYMIFSSKGYYSFRESNNWLEPTFRNSENYKTESFILPSFNYQNVIEQKAIINHLLESYDEIFLSNNKIYYSSCLPLEKIKKEIENEKEENIFFIKKDKSHKENILLISNFLKPVAFIEVSSDGDWEAIF